MVAESGWWTFRVLSITCWLLLLLLAAAAAWIIALRLRIRRLAGTIRAELERASESEKRLQHAQRMEAIGRLAGGVAHSFNNHLTSILGFSELLLEMIPPKNSCRDAIEAIRRAAARGSEFTRQLYILNRKQSLQLQPLNLNTLLSEMGPSLRILTGDKIDLRMELGSGLGPAMLDRSQIEVVITNLVSHACSALQGGGQITIETTNVDFADPLGCDTCELKPGSYVRIAVRDNGAGMDENLRMHIFEPFFLPKQKSKGDGLALGLVYNIIKQSSGEVSVSSETGKGTTFVAYFPRLQEGAPGGG